MKKRYQQKSRIKKKKIRNNKTQFRIQRLTQQEDLQTKNAISCQFQFNRKKQKLIIKKESEEIKKNLILFNKEPIILNYFTNIKQNQNNQLYDSLILNDRMQKESQNNNEMKQQFICKCKKSKCLSKQCSCFLKGKYCDNKCQCNNCQNFLQNYKEIQQTITQINNKNKNNIPIHCKCTKSQCQKKYCKCFELGQNCSFNCKCQDCNNIFISNNVFQHVQEISINQLDESLSKNPFKFQIYENRNQYNLDFQENEIWLENNR